jgi:hypothetical protein
MKKKWFKGVGVAFHNVVGPRAQKPKLIPKINIPYFWNNYIVCIIILNPKVPKRGSP